MHREKITSIAILDREAGTLVNSLNAIPEEHVLQTKELLDTKGWQIEELSLLKTDFTSKQNRITVLCCQGKGITQTREVAHCARRLYLDLINKQNKQHWKDFLNNPKNVWKAVSYTKPSGAAIDIPELVVGERQY